MIENDPNRTVFGVGIIQQANVARAVAALGILDDCLEASSALERVEIHVPSGQLVARIGAPLRFYYQDDRIRGRKGGEMPFGFHEPVAHTGDRIRMEVPARDATSLFGRIDETVAGAA